METKRIRVGIIGIGNIGAAHLEAVRALGYADAAAIAVRDAARAKELCAAYSIPTYYTDYREMLADPDIDVVHDCTPNTAHFRINKDCILAGKHLLSEKPLTALALESAELLELAKSRGIFTAVNFVYRHYPQVRRMRGMVERGELGTIYAIHGAYLQDWLLFDSDYDWRVEAAVGGPSRAMADIGSHWCDLARFLLGQDISEVCADLATFVPVRTRILSGEPRVERRVAVDTEDYASVLARFSGGTRGCFTLSQASAGRKLGLSLEIDGSKASAYWNQESADRLWIGRRDGPSEESGTGQGSSGEGDRGRDPRAGKREAQKDLIDAFYRTILHGDDRRYADFSDGHEMVKVVEAVLESGRERRWVKTEE